MFVCVCVYVCLCGDPHITIEALKKTSQSCVCVWEEGVGGGGGEWIGVSVGLCMYSAYDTVLQHIL